MNIEAITETEQREGMTFEVLDLSRTLTKTLDKLREYIQRGTDVIIEDARSKSLSELVEVIQEGMAQRDIDVVTNTLKSWTEDNLKDLLYELEYQRFMDIKIRTSDVFHQIILPHIQKKELGNDIKYTVAYGDSASIIDIKTLSMIHHLYSEYGITGGKLDVANTDIAYFNSDTTRSGESKTISPRQPVEVTETCIADLINDLTGDNGTSLNRDRKRRLKYHRAKLIIGDLTLDGKPFVPPSDAAAPAIKRLATGLFINRMFPGGHRYYIALRDVSLGMLVNTAIWEIYYGIQTKTQENIPHMINTEFPEKKLVLYSLGESVDATYLIRLGSQHLKKGKEEAKRATTCHSVCVGMVESNNIDKKEISLNLRLLIGPGWVQRGGVTVEYSQLFTHHPMNIITTRTTDQLIQPLTVHNNQRIFIPADHSWDMVHPSRANFTLGREIAEDALPIHWYDL